MINNDSKYTKFRVFEAPPAETDSFPTSTLFEWVGCASSVYTVALIVLMIQVHVFPTSENSNSLSDHTRDGWSGHVFTHIFTIFGLLHAWLQFTWTRLAIDTGDDFRRWYAHLFATNVFVAYTGVGIITQEVDTYAHDVFFLLVIISHFLFFTFVMYHKTKSEHGIVAFTTLTLLVGFVLIIAYRDVWRNAFTNAMMWVEGLGTILVLVLSFLILEMELEEPTDNNQCPISWFTVSMLVIAMFFVFCISTVSYAIATN